MKSKFLEGLLGAIEGIKSGQETVKLLEDLGRTQGGKAGLEALAALLGLRGAAALNPIAPPAAFGLVAITTAVRFWLWWKGEQEKHTEAAKLAEVQAILRSWQGSASGGWAALDGKLGPRDDSSNPNLVEFLECLFRYELGELKGTVAALTAHDEVRFEQLADQMAKYQRENYQVFKDLRDALNSSLGTSLVCLISESGASDETRREIATTLGPKLRNLLEMPDQVAVTLRRVEVALAPKVLLKNPSPKKHLSELNRLTYGQRWTSLVGVEEPLQRLRDFCDGERFSWLILTAPGGCGKSRLAQELCDELWLSGWNTGFYEGTKNLDSWREIDISEPTLIVVDNFWSDFESWPQIIHALGDYEGQIPLRLLLLDRPSDPSAWNKMLDAYPEAADTYGGMLDEKCRVVPFRLNGIPSDQDVWALMCQVWKGATPVQYSDLFGSDTIGYRHMDQIGRPLFVILTALALLEQSFRVLRWDLNEITNAVIRRLLGQLRLAGVDDNHLRLLLAATISNGLDLSVQPPLSGLPVPDKWSEEICRHISAYSEDFVAESPRIPPLVPDPIGEAFVIYCLEGNELCDSGTNRVERLKLAGEVVAWCAENYELETMGFVRQVSGDFPENLETVLGFVSSLRDLSLFFHRLDTLPDISNMTNLSELSFAALEVSVPMKVTTPVHCRSLFVNLTPLCCLPDLSRFESLISLYASSCELESIRGVKDAPQLGALFVHYNHISDLQELMYLKNLRHLKVNVNKICDISAIQELTSLISLDIEQNPISAPDRVRLPPSLQGLYVGHCSHARNLFDAELDKLRELHAERCSLESLSFLERTRNVRHLRIADNPITDASGILHLAELEALDIDLCIGFDIRHLFQLKKLRFLSAVGTGHPESEFLALKRHLGTDVEIVYGFPTGRLITWNSLVDD